MMKKIILQFSISIYFVCFSAAYAAEVSVSEFHHAQKTNVFRDVLIDVRTPFEVEESGIIEGAVVKNAYGVNFEKDISKLDKTKTYLIYCHSGARSSKTVMLMKKYGITANNLTGGILAWKKNGYKFVPNQPGISRAVLSINFEKRIYELIKKDHKLNIELPFLLKQIQENEKFIFLDTRELNEFQVSHLPGAIHVGYEDFDLKKAIKLIPKNENIVVYCSVGFRSDKINRQLVKAGYKSKNLIGGIFEWVNQNQKVYQKKKPTSKVHTYNKDWSKWLDKGEKIY